MTQATPKFLNVVFCTFLQTTPRKMNFTMKKSRYTDAQIMGILRQADSGIPVASLCREHGMSSASFYKWRAKYGGMDASMMRRLKELEDENRRLKRMYSDLSIRTEIVKDALQKKW